jgi:hypothetical protein
MGKDGVHHGASWHHAGDNGISRHGGRPRTGDSDKSLQEWTVRTQAVLFVREASIAENAWFAQQHEGGATCSFSSSSIV